MAMIYSNFLGITLISDPSSSNTEAGASRNIGTIAGHSDNCIGYVEHEGTPVSSQERCSHKK